MSQEARKNKYTLVHQSTDSERIAFLEAENLRLRNIISLLPGNVFWKNNQGKFLGCNNNVADIFGLSSPDEIIGKSNADLFGIGSGLAIAADTSDQAVYDSAKEQCNEEHGFDINQEPATYLTKKIPLFDKYKNITGILGISFNISDRIKMETELKLAKEHAEASNLAKSQFLAMINHELGTPLTSAIGLIHFLKQNKVNQSEDEKNLIHSLENCLEHLLSLVNDILDFSRLEKAKYNLNLSYFYLPNIIHEVYNLLHLNAKKKNLELSIELDETQNLFIMSDARIVRQILINLISNAIKFTEKGSIKIQVQTLQSSEHAIILKIAVIDTGKGIPADKLEWIFEPFHQLEDTYTRKSSRQGTGLGLSIIKKLTELIGASIQVSSTLGQGSTFSFISEFELANKESIDKTFLQPEIQESEIKLVKKLRVLLVEDDPIIQFIHKKMLEEFECIVTVTSLGQTAISTITEHDIIFIDLNLPDISGFEVIKFIRQQSHKTPLIALTVHTGEDEKQACLDAGANEFASKPITSTHLKKILFNYGAATKESAALS